MATLTPEQIKEITEQFDCGFRCFVNTKTSALVFIPDQSKYFDMDMNVWAEELKMLKTHKKDFKEIEPLDSGESFKIMEDFIDVLPDSINLKNELINALQRKKPFREFKFVIDNSGEYRQQWFDFKNKWLQNWVQERFNEMTQP